MGRRAELVVWTVPWLATVALWAVVLHPIGPAPVLALGLGTLSHLAWQLTALAARQALTAMSVAWSTQT